MTDDKALVTRILEGDEQAYRLLIRQNERLVAHMVGRLVKQQEDLEEVCQDVFLRVFDKIGEFSFQSRLSTWIGTIAYRHAINHIRKNKVPVDSIHDDDQWTDRLVDADNPEQNLAETDMESWIFKMVDKLPPAYRTVLMLYHRDEMNYAEIAAITEMPEGTVKNYIFRARNILKERIKPYLDKP